MSQQLPEVRVFQAVKMAAQDSKGEKLSLLKKQKKTGVVAICQGKGLSDGDGKLSSTDLTGPFRPLT